jgi:hypothetical protein
MVRAVCDSTSVGVLITGDDGRYLMSAQAAWPDGIAPPAGHVTDWVLEPDYPAAARALVTARLRTDLKSLEPASTGGWRGDRCCRPTGPAGTGHQWQIYTATLTGIPAPPQGRARRTHWLTEARIQRLAYRTARYAHGRISDSEFFTQPGIQPVWVAFLASLGIITMTVTDLAAIDRLARTGDTL